MDLPLPSGLSTPRRPRAWRDKIVRLRKQPPYVTLQSLLNKVPFQPITIDGFYLLLYDGVPSLQAHWRRGLGDIRAGTPADIGGMAQCENTPEIFRNRFMLRDPSVVAIINDRLAGYEWFCERAWHLDEQYAYPIKLSPDAIYAYDGFILPQYRIGGVWLKFKEYLANLMRDRGKKKIITMINYGNQVSLNTHIRFGFKPFRSVLVIRLLGKRIFIERVLPTSESDLRSGVTGTLRKLLDQILAPRPQ